MVFTVIIIGTDFKGNIVKETVWVPNPDRIYSVNFTVIGYNFESKRLRLSQLLPGFEFRPILLKDRIA